MLLHRSRLAARHPERPFLAPFWLIALLALEPHMSGIVLTVAVVGTILLLSGSGGILTWVGAGTAGLMLETLLSHVDSIPYLQDRLDGWTHDLSKMTDQTLQSLYAIGSGGAAGLGLGSSRQKHLFVPEPQNDFIFSIVCEELGFVGACAVVGLFVLLLWRGITIAAHAPDRFGALLVVGFVVQVILQAILNIAVVTNTIPNTGISLPFFSYGGSSVVTLFAAMGFVSGIKKRTVVRRRSGRPGPSRTRIVLKSDGSRSFPPPTGRQSPHSPQAGMRSTWIARPSGSRNLTNASTLNFDTFPFIRSDACGAVIPSRWAVSRPFHPCSRMRSPIAIIRLARVSICATLPGSSGYRSCHTLLAIAFPHQIS